MIRFPRSRDKLQSSNLTSDVRGSEIGGFWKISQAPVLFIYGAAKSGKTGLLIDLAKDIAENGWDVKFVCSPEASRWISENTKLEIPSDAESFSRQIEDAKRILCKRITTAEESSAGKPDFTPLFLILDDVGTLPRSSEDGQLDRTTAESLRKLRDLYRLGKTFNIHVVQSFLVNGEQEIRSLVSGEARSNALNVQLVSDMTEFRNPMPLDGRIETDLIYHRMIH